MKNRYFISCLFVALLVQPWQANAQWQEFFNLDRPGAFMVGANGANAIIQSARDSLYWSQDYGQHFEPLPLEGVSVEEASGIFRFRLYPDQYLLATYRHLYRFDAGAQAWDNLFYLPGHTIKDTYRHGDKIAIRIFDESTPINKIYHSNDAGATWTAAQEGLPVGFSVGQTISYDSILVAFNYNHESYYSTDLGASWQASPANNAACRADDVVAHSGPNVLARNTCGGMSFSGDGGVSWIDAAGFALLGISRGQVTQSGNSLFALLYDDLNFGNFYRSDDQGANWFPVQGINGLYRSNKFLGATSNGTLVLFTNPGLYVSTDQGASWQQTLDLSVESFVGVRITGAQVYVLGDGVYYASSDHGLTWTDRSEILPRAPYEVLSFGVYDSAWLVGARNTLLSSTDEGQTWVRGPLCNARCFLETEQGLFAGGDDQSVFWPLQFSSDQGATWAYDATWPFGPARLNALLEVNGKLFAAGEDAYQTTKIFSFTDGDLFWEESVNGIPYNARAVESLAYAPATGKLYATGKLMNNLYVSTDVGASWTSAGPYAGSSIVVQDSSVYVFAHNTLHFTLDDGANWHTVTDPLLEGLGTQRNALLVYGDQVLVCGSTGLFRSRDKGFTWEAFGDRLRTTETQSISNLTRDSTFIYATVNGQTIHRRPLEELLDSPPTLLTESICQGSSYTFDGQELSQAGTYSALYTAANGGDSTVTLNLSVIAPITTSIATTTCQDEGYPFNGDLLTASGEYTANLLAASGCDSVVTLQLTVIPAIFTTLSETICTGESIVYQGETLSESGTYPFVLLGAAGCDSIVNFNLTVNMINTGVTLNNNVLEAQAPNATYQWIDCLGNVPIPGATASTYAPDATGLYAVVVMQDGCTATSVCTEVIVVSASNLLPAEAQWQLQPNPAQNRASLVFESATSIELDLRIYDATGRLLSRRTLASATERIDLDLSAWPDGVFFVRLAHQAEVSTKRLLKAAQ